MLSDPEMSPIKANMESGKYQGENGYELLQSDIKAINMDPTRKAQHLQMLSRTVKPKS